LFLRGGERRHCVAYIDYDLVLDKSSLGAQLGKLALGGENLTAGIAPL